MKKMKNLTQLGVASALIGASLLFSACGGSTSKAEKLAKQTIEKDLSSAKILSFDEAKKELGLTNKECLAEITEMYSWVWNVVEKDGKLEVIEVMIKNDNNFAGIKDTYSVDEFKSKKPQCFK